MKTKYIVPHIETTLLVLENELAAGFNQLSGGTPPNPPKTTANNSKEELEIEEDPMLVSTNQLWESEDD